MTAATTAAKMLFVVLFITFFLLPFRLGPIHRGKISPSRNDVHKARPIVFVRPCPTWSSLQAAASQWQGPLRVGGFFQKHPAGWQINGHRGEAGQKPVSKQASFTGENRGWMEGRWNIVKNTLSDLDFRLCYGKAHFGERDGDLGRGIPWLDFGAYPMQGAVTTGIQPHPLRTAAVYVHRNLKCPVVGAKRNHHLLSI